MNKLIISNLVHRPIRSLISITAIAMEVTLILVIVGLSLGMLNDSKRRQEGIGADVMVQPPGASGLGLLSSAPVPVGVADKIRALKHVKAVTPIITQFNTAGTVEVLYGIDLKSFEDVGGPLHYLEGRPFQKPDEILVDDFFADYKKLHVGSKMELLNHTFTVSGIVEHGRGARKFFQLTALQDLLGAQGKASIFYVKADDPDNAQLVADEIKGIDGMQQYTVRTMREWLTLMTPDKVPGLGIFIQVVVGVAVVIGFIVIFQAMYTAVMERTREIGILKSLGASKAYIMNVVLRETALLSIAGIVLGVLISAIAQRGLVQHFPTIRVELTGQWILNAVVIALVGALLGAIYPAFKAAQKDPIDALAYE
ncbi:MAG TPA: FtsX-like permease family protein [Terriglobales bacterium]|jgi:putative ABC transport system permease protein|nr:FtsX-like permease family protein [Terriglobales bacterium]